MKKLTMLLMLCLMMFSSLSYSMSDEAKNYSLDASEFRGHPKMLMNKGIMVFSSMPGVPLTLTTETVVHQTMLPLKLTIFSEDNMRLEWMTWYKDTPSRNMGRGDFYSCADDEDMMHDCDFMFGRLYFDFINENEGIVYFRSIDTNNYMYFTFDPEPVMPTQREYLDRILKENL